MYCKMSQRDIPSCSNLSNFLKSHKKIFLKFKISESLKGKYDIQMYCNFKFVIVIHIKAYFLQRITDVW